MPACVTELDVKIRNASRRLTEVKALGDETLTEFYLDELNRLLDEKLEAGMP